VPNIEGIMRSYVYAKGLTGNGKNPKMPEIYNAFTDEYDLSNWLIAEVFLYQLESNIYSYKSFDNELKKTITSRFVNRHTMLHGIAFNYDREIHSLKAFLLLDAVSALPV
jgi:phage antirepressor YoqD-like protein